MSVSYNPSIATDVDKVRFLVQDTNVDSAKFQDEEIQWLVSTEANVYMAAAALCDQLVARAGLVTKKRIGDLSIEYDPLFYKQLGGQMRARGSGHQVPYAGGVSVVDKNQNQSNSDNTSPSVFRRQDDNTAAPSKSTPPENPLERLL